MRWLAWRPREVWFDGWWAVSQDRPWLGVTYVRAVLSSSDLWGKCTISTELEIHSNGHVLGIGQVTVWSSRRVFCMVTDSWLCIWLLWSSEYIFCDYYRCDSIYHCHISLIMALLISYHLPAWWGGTCWVRLYPPICYCVFSSRSRLHAWGVWVEGVRMQVDPVGVSTYLEWCYSRRV
jgi:hypothetical protein